MAQITAAMVKQLREMTDSPMMECKKALVEADGDPWTPPLTFSARTACAKAATKKAGRGTNHEGAVAAYISEDGKTGALVELSCETDFVASNPKFTGFASSLAKVVADVKPADVEALLAAEMNGETVEAELTELIHVMGENMKIARFAVRTVEAGALSLPISTWVVRLAFFASSPSISPRPLPPMRSRLLLTMLPCRSLPRLRSAPHREGRSR